MIQVIPLDYNRIDVVKEFKFKNVYCFPLEHITKLLVYKNFPIKNRNIALKNILDFLQFVDVKMSELKTESVTLHRHKLNEFFGSKSVTSFLEILSSLNILHRKRHMDGSYYEIGKHSCMYSFDDSFSHSELCFVVLDISERKRKIIENVKVDKRFRNTILNTEIDAISAIRDEIESMKCVDSLRKRISRIFNFIQNDRYIKKGNKVDRIYHSLTSISKISRKHLTIKGKKFMSIDIVNCQPMFLCYLLKKKNLSYDGKYIQDCENGVFYEQFGGIRDEVKVKLYKSVFFKWQSKNEINLKFKELYPITWNSLNDLAMSLTCEMATLLQNCEAEIINGISPLSESYFTLFDAIYFTNPVDKLVIEDALYKKLLPHGIVPKFKFE